MAGKATPSLIGNQKAAAAAVASPAAPARGPLKWFVITTGDKIIRRPGKEEYVIRQGKEINDAEYDIALLKSRGVGLEPIKTPAWWKEAQLAGDRKRDELASRGINLPPAEPYVDPDEAPAAAAS
jgi:hypothetical protein